MIKFKNVFRRKETKYHLSMNIMLCEKKISTYLIEDVQATRIDGVLTVDGRTNSGNDALDYEGNWTQDGGIPLAIGSQDISMTPIDDSTQASLGIYLDNTSSDA